MARKFIGGLILLLAMQALSGPKLPGERQGVPGAPADVSHPTANLLEGRLRKIHLVRPDLILYPVYYDVIC
jgi:hypothetical protein